MNDKSYKEAWQAINGWRHRMAKSADDHTSENGVFDYTTGHMEFGNECTEDFNCHLWDILEEFDEHFKSILANPPTDC